MGPDPTTGLLTTRFTVYYGVGDLSTGLGGGLSDIEGIVSIEDPIKILPVRHNIMHSHAHTQANAHALAHAHTCPVLCSCR